MYVFTYSVGRQASRQVRMRLRYRVQPASQPAIPPKSCSRLMQPCSRPDMQPAGLLMSRQVKRRIFTSISTCLPTYYIVAQTDTGVQEVPEVQSMDTCWRYLAYGGWVCA